jgi:hypothetical protein
VTWTIHGLKSIFYFLGDMSNNREDDGYLKYILAASVFATAFGNIFVARRLKSIPKAPRGFYADKNKPKSGPNRESEKYKTTGSEREQQRHREYHWQKEQQRIMREAYGHMGRRSKGGINTFSVPNSVAMNLRALEMSTDHIPTKDELSKAYRVIAMKYHPDRSPEDPAESEVKFKAANTAYRQVSLYLEQQEKLWK